jgi:hypothetical protein
MKKAVVAFFFFLFRCQKKKKKGDGNVAAVAFFAKEGEVAALRYCNAATMPLQQNKHTKKVRCATTKLQLS